jgi:hypothetical protein
VFYLNIVVGKVERTHSFRGVISSGIHIRMLLDEKDPITTGLILTILCSGMAGLTPTQKDILSGFFLHKIKAPMRCFTVKYAMSSQDVHSQIEHALAELRQHFESNGIMGTADFCAG